MLTQEQRDRLEELRRNRISRDEYMTSGGVRRCNVSLDKGEETLAQWIRRELTIMLQARIDDWLDEEVLSFPRNKEA